MLLNFKASPGSDRWVEFYGSIRVNSSRSPTLSMAKLALPKFKGVKCFVTSEVYCFRAQDVSPNIFRDSVQLRAHSFSVL